MCGSPAPSCFFLNWIFKLEAEQLRDETQKERDRYILCCTGWLHFSASFTFDISLSAPPPSFLPDSLRFCSEKRIDDKRRSFTTTWGSFIISYHFQKDDTDVGKKKKTITKCKTDLKSLQKKKKREKFLAQFNIFYYFPPHPHSHKVLLLLLDNFVRDDDGSSCCCCFHLSSKSLFFPWPPFKKLLTVILFFFYKKNVFGQNNWRFTLKDEGCCCKGTAVHQNLPVTCQDLKTVYFPSSGSGCWFPVSLASLE